MFLQSAGALGDRGPRRDHVIHHRNVAPIKRRTRVFEGPGHVPAALLLPHSDLGRGLSDPAQPFGHSTPAESPEEPVRLVEAPAPFAAPVERDGHRPVRISVGDGGIDPLRHEPGAAFDTPVLETVDETPGNSLHLTRNHGPVDGKPGEASGAESLFSPATPTVPAATLSADPRQRLPAATAEECPKGAAAEAALRIQDACKASQDPHGCIVDRFRDSSSPTMAL